MGNVRVFQLARDLGLSSQEVIDRLKKLGMEVKTASSSVDEDTADKLRRALKIDQLTTRKKRIYGSEDDESEREQQQRLLEARIAAEKEERERAAAAALAAAEARKANAGKPKPKEVEKKPAEEVAPALAHGAAAPRLAPKLATPPPTALLDEPELEEADAEVEAEAEPEVETEAEPEAEPEELEPETVPVMAMPAPVPPPPAIPIAPPAPAPVAAAPPPAPAAEAAPPRMMTPPRVTGPVRPIAPPPPPPPPVVAAPPPPPPPAPAPTPRPVQVSAAATTAGPVSHVRTVGPARPIAPPRPIVPSRPIAPPRPISPHPTSPHATAGQPLPRSPHPVGLGRPGAGPMRPVNPMPGRPPMAPPPGMTPRPAPRPVQRRDRTKGLPAPVEEKRPVYTGPPRMINLTEGVTVKELGEKMADVKSRDIMKALLTRGIMATINQTLEPELAIQICKEFGYEASIQTFEEEMVKEQDVESKPEDLSARAPVITVMGHVDHGKTSLLDSIRETSVAAGEAGGITQHIGAYHVNVGSRKVVFLDTPGHEAFTLMRARGAKVTDIVILVVAADDGVMPQTVEAIDHAKAAGVPIVVAVNKVDKADAQPDRVRQQLSDHGLIPEEWGGTTVFVNVSAKKKMGLEQLLEMLLLVADLQELKANPKKHALGTVLESRLDKGRGPVATVLVQDGTLSVGDMVVAGAVSGKVRALVDEHGERQREAGPATPVELLGLSALPEPGDQLVAVADSVKAQQIVGFRQLKLREKAMAASSRIRLEDLGKAIAQGELQELALVLKADVQGSIEALADQLKKLPQEKIKLRIIRSGVGAITESDVLLAAASNAIIVGFNVRPERKAADVAEREKVELRLYTVIYDIADDMKKAMEGLLAPTTREVRLGAAEVRDTFKISRVGTVAGCYVTDGKVNRNAQVRLLRDNVVIHTGRVASLKRFKEDVTEVRTGMECGIGIAGYNDVKPGDVIEFFTTETVRESLA
jgi:translation initiation factor IF-2